MKAIINGAAIFCAEAGRKSSPAVTFIHGFPFSHRMWEPQLDATAQEFHAIAFDLRGHGESEIGDGQYTIEMHVDDLLGLLDHLDVRKTAVVGLSMGGYIALRALERNPDRFSAAVFCDTRSEADSNESKLKRAAVIASVKRTGSAAYAESMVKDLLSPETFETNPAAVHLIRGIIAATPPLSIAGTSLALASRTDTTASLGRIRVPVLLMGGERDVLTPPSVLRSMHEHIPGSEFFIVPHAGHVSNLENPVFFNEKLLAFLKRSVHES